MNRASLCKAALAVTVAALGLSACSARVHAPYVAGVETPRLVPAALGPSRYDYKASFAAPAVEAEGATEGYEVRTLAWPATGDNRQEGNLVTARHYKSTKSGEKPLIIILPIWGKYTFPSNTLAAHLMGRSSGELEILKVHGENFLFDWKGNAAAVSEDEFFARMDRNVTRMIDAVNDIRRMVDWARRQPGVDPDRVAVVGFSVSAVAASLTLAHEPRLGAGILVMGGADLPGVFSACDSMLEDLRNAALQRFGWSVEEYREKITAPLAPIEPGRYRTRIDPRRILIIEAEHDTCMPRPGREQLWQAMGQPERVAYLYDHKMSFMSMTFLGAGTLQEEVYRFVEKTFMPEAPAVLTQADRTERPPSGY